MPETNGDGYANLRKLFEKIGIEPKLTFIGGGKLASALIDGFISSGVLTKDDIAVSVKNESSVQRWKLLGYCNVYTSNDALLRDHGRGIVFLSVKPQMRTAMFKDLNGKAFVNTPLIVSVMSGVNLTTLENEVSLKGYPAKRGVIRLMPNIPASVRAGASIMCASSNLQREKIDLIECIMRCVGMCLEITEKAFDAATAVAGCGPAFVFIAIEALADGGVLGGIDRETSMKLAAQTVMGAAKMVLESGEHPAALKDDVCSAGGTTIYGVKELEKSAFRSALIEAVHMSTKRSAGEI